MSDVLPAMVLMDVADRLEDGGPLVQLKGLELPTGSPDVLGALAHRAAVATYTRNSEQGKATWRELERVSSSCHRAMEAEDPNLREVLLRHIGMLTAWVMDLDRRAKESEGAG